MKKTLCLWMLLASIPVALNAQSDKTFEAPHTLIFNRKFMIDLGNKNKLSIWLSDINDLERLSNLDSIVKVFLKDIEPLKDSLTNELSAKSINHVTDIQNRKKIQLLQYPTIGSTFLVDRGGLAALRTVQDTIYIVGILPNPPKPADKVSLKHPRYYSLTFYLNDWSDVRSINGNLNAKIKTLLANINGKWVKLKGAGIRHLQADNTITANQPRGHVAGADFLAGYITVNAQNYKHYFVPSFSIGLRATLTNKERSYKWVPGLLWEPYFFFARDVQNKLKTYRNDFLTLIYAQGGTKDRDPRKEFSYSTHLSLGYLVHRSGDYFDKNTFHLGAGQVHFLKTTIEPGMYFNKLFKGVSPSIKISQAF
jgi:hypothetical protein